MIICFRFALTPSIEPSDCIYVSFVDTLEYDTDGNITQWNFVTVITNNIVEGLSILVGIKLLSIKLKIMLL